MIGHASVVGRKVGQSRGGRADATVAVPLLVLDLGRGCDPHQARCRCCRWRSRWWATAAQAEAEHARHQQVAHGRGRPVGRGRRGLVTWRRLR
jgi:hypothetical protein